MLDIDKILEALKACENNDDIESAHGDADDILCKILIDLGYPQIVEAYRRVPKWYA